MKNQIEKLLLTYGDCEKATYIKGDETYLYYDVISYEEPMQLRVNKTIECLPIEKLNGKRWDDIGCLNY